MTFSPPTPFVKNLPAFLLLLGGIAVKAAGSSFFLSYSSLMLEARGWSNSLIGIGHAVQIGTVMLVALGIPWLLRHASLAAGLLLATLVTLAGFQASYVMLNQESVPLAGFLLARFLVGLGLGTSYLLGETWLNSLAEEKYRSTLLGLYGAALGLGLGGGPLFLPLTGTAGYLPVAVCSAAVAMFTLVVAYCYRTIPHLPYLDRRLAWKALLLSPTALAAAVAFGMIDASMLTLLPLYGLDVGFSNMQALSLIMTCNAGSILMMIPLSWLADRTHRRKMLASCAFLAAATTGLMPLTAHSFAGTSVLVFLWGGFFSMLYFLALAMLGARFANDNVAIASMTVILMYGLGSLIGPAAGGAAMDAFGPHGLPLTFAAACLASLAVTLLRMRKEQLR